MMKLPAVELGRRFEEDMDQTYVDWNDMVQHNESFKCPPPCTWRRFPGINDHVFTLSEAFNAHLIGTHQMFASTQHVCAAHASSKININSFFSNVHIASLHPSFETMLGSQAACIGWREGQLTGHCFHQQQCRIPRTRGTTRMTMTRIAY